MTYNTVLSHSPRADLSERGANEAKEVEPECVAVNCCRDLCVRVKSEWVTATDGTATDDCESANVWMTLKIVEHMSLSIVGATKSFVVMWCVG
jgi:hypothetical protein